ncbi:putative guanylate kinase [Cooperia oncophora]
MPCRPIVLSGPSGGGKSTILSRAMKEYPNSFAFSVSHTTRKPREGEEHGVHYWFTDHEEMQRMIANGEFLEHATFRRKYIWHEEARLRARGTEKEEDIAKRLKHAREDLAAVEQDPDLFDHIIINDDLERAYKEFIHIIEEDLMSISN